MNWNEIEISNFYRNYFVDSVIRERCQNSDYILIYIFDDTDLESFNSEQFAYLSIGVYFSTGRNIKHSDYIPYGYFDCYPRSSIDNNFEGIKAHKKIRDKMYKLKAKFRKWNPNILIEVDTTIWNFVEE